MRELSHLSSGWKLTLAALSAACIYNAASLWRASRPHPAVTLVSPWVAPGDDLELDVVFERDIVEGRLTSAEERRVVYPVSPEQPIGSKVELELELTGPAAGPWARDADNPRANLLSLQIPLFSPLERAARRAVSGLCGAACLVLVVLFAARVVEPRVRGSQSPAIVRIGTWIIVGPLLLLAAVKGAVQPIAAALAIGGTTQLWLASVMVVGVSLFLSTWLCGPRRPKSLNGTFVLEAKRPVGDYRTVGAASVPPLDELAAAIGRGRARATIEGEALVARAPWLSRDTESRVTIRPTDDGAHAVVFNDSELLAAVLAALAPTRGQVELSIERPEGELRYVIQDARTAAEFVVSFRAAQRGQDDAASRSAPATG